jgi:hypothetical protein
MILAGRALRCAKAKPDARKASHRPEAEAPEKGCRLKVAQYGCVSPLRHGETDMARGKASGYSLTTQDARVVSGMQARGDRDHDIAAWFGVNQGRVAEVKDGKFGTVSAVPSNELPPKGPPGVKGRRLRRSVEDALSALDNGDIDKANAILKEARKRYDASEA